MGFCIRFGVFGKEDNRVLRAFGLYKVKKTVWLVVRKSSKEFAIRLKVLVWSDVIVGKEYCL